MTKNDFTIQFSNFYQGASPLAHLDSLTEMGNAGNYSTATNIDVISNPAVLTQGSGLANLTNGTQAGAVSELINFIMDKAVSDDVSFAIGATKLFKISATTVSNTSPFPHTITNAIDGESCINMKGNLYYFYNKASGGDIGKYDLATTFDDDWGCYSEDTEVFTVDGWKLIKDVEIGEKIYSFNPETQNVEITTNKETINKPFSGEMISFKNEGVDLLTTPDHKMYAGFRKMKNRKTFTDWRIVRADSLLSKTEIKLKKNANWDGKIINEWTVPEYDNGSINKITRDKFGRIVSCSGRNYYRPERKFPIKPFLRLLGFYISEGSSSEKCINISQKTYSKGWQPIKDTLDELGFNYGYYGNGFDIHDKQLTQYIKKLIPGYCNEKRIPKEILKLDKSLLIELYEAMMLGDGYLKTNQYYTVSEGLKDDFIELVNRLGWSSSLFIKDRRGQKVHNGIACYINFTIGVIKIKNETTLNHHKFFSGKILKEHYKGNIGCLALEKNHIMLVRRNGKSVWCGNSTTPTGAGALQKAIHPVAVKEDIMIFGNGRYLGTYIEGSNTLAPTKLDFGEGNEVADVCFHANQWYVAVNSGVSGTNRNIGRIFVYDGSALSSILDDEVSVGVQRIGFLFPVNGIIYLAYQDLSSDGGYKIGYISGRRIIDISYFTGSLPSFAQRTLYKNTILFLSDNKVYSSGAVIDNLPIQLSQIADGGYATVGAISAPFGTPMIASTESTNYKLAKFSGYDINCSWRSIIIPLIQGRMIGHIDSVSVLTDTLGEDARCDLILQYNKASSDSSAYQITTENKRRHIFNIDKGRIEDFRVYLDFSSGSASNNVAIRKIIVSGHYSEL